jgi:hypothetical protein
MISFCDNLINQTISKLQELQFLKKQNLRKPEILEKYFALSARCARCARFGFG